MKPYRKASLFLALVIGASALAPLAQYSPASATTAATPAAPPAGLRGWALQELTAVENKMVRLAEATPQEKFTWRPGEGVRSISEVYLHVAGGNFGYPTLLGMQPPAGIERRGLEKSTTEKAKVVQLLKQSFDHMRQAAEKTSDADLDKPVKLFGREASYREVLLQAVTHAHEHLGQSIAYARMNGIVPPWTEERMQQQRQQERPKN